MSWSEAARLARVLINDPSSQTCASVREWSAPISRDSIVLADLFDLQHKKAAGGKRIDPYPRPWPAEGVRQIGDVKSLDPQQAREVLRRNAGREAA